MSNLENFFEKLYGDYTLEQLIDVRRYLFDDSYINHALIPWINERIEEKENSK